MVLNLQDHRKRGEDIRVVNIKKAPPAQKAVVASSSSSTGPSQQARTSTASNSSSKGKITHVVSKGDTLFAISKKYGVTVNDLKSWNNIGSQNIISIGQKLVIFTP